VRYDTKAVMTYSLNAHAPWEGYRVMFNGSKGRLEFQVVETPYISGHHQDFNTFGMHELEMPENGAAPEIVFRPHWGRPRVVEYEKGDLGGHGGGDARLLRDIFRGVQDDSLGHAAGYLDGAKSILTGIAGNISMRTGQPVRVRDLVRF